VGGFKLDERAAAPVAPRAAPVHAAPVHAAPAHEPKAKAALPGSAPKAAVAELDAPKKGGKDKPDEEGWEEF